MPKETFLERRKKIILDSLGARIVPEGDGFTLSQGRSKVTERMLDYLGSAREPLKNGFTILIFLVEYMAIFFTLSFKPFSKLSTAQQDKYLRGWEHSRFVWRRNLFFVLKTLFMSFFYSDDNIAKKLGYEVKPFAE